MNIASLELCKELLKLSGWSDTTFVFRFDGNSFTPSIRHPEIDSPTLVPAYDLGYLLRKLPTRTSISKLYRIQFEKTVIYQADSLEISGVETADTPEDAACKLAIELFKQGVLK